MEFVWETCFYALGDGQEDGSEDDFVPSPKRGKGTSGKGGRGTASKAAKGRTGAQHPASSGGETLVIENK